MFNSKEYTGKNVIFLPNYTVANLLANDITLSDFENALLYATEGYRNLKTILEKVSKYDIADMYVCNMVLNNSAFGEDSHGSMHDAIKWGIPNFLESELYMSYKELTSRYKDVINNLLSKECILLSDNDEKVNYTFDVQENTIFVIIHNGFTDLVVRGNSEMKHEFMHVLINKMFNVFGEEQTLAHSYTKAFLK